MNACCSEFGRMLGHTDILNDLLHELSHEAVKFLSRSFLPNRRRTRIGIHMRSSVKPGRSVEFRLSASSLPGCVEAKYAATSQLFDSTQKHRAAMWDRTQMRASDVVICSRHLGLTFQNVRSRAHCCLRGENQVLIQSRPWSPHCPPCWIAYDGVLFRYCTS